MNNRSVSYKLEICANGFNSALAAQLGGADRVELCDNLAEGGTTPSFGQLKACIEQLTIPTFPIIRPRSGDFLYNDPEFEIMRSDISIFKDLGCKGLVFGILTANGEIDEVRCSKLIELANGMECTFHRAFDMVADMASSLEKIIDLGFTRILTSGGGEKAMDKLDVIARLHRQASGRISIMAGSGLTPQNIGSLLRETGISEVHASLRRNVPSKMTFKNPDATMGVAASEYETNETDAELVAQMVTQIRNVHNENH